MKTEIDWSKAPEGATHWDTGMNMRVAGWMKLDDGIWHWWPVKGAKCDMKWHSALNQHLIDTEQFIARPNDWTGKGLPPVGTVCEHGRLAPGEWVRVEIVAHRRFKGCGFLSAVYVHDDGVGHASAGEHFRPIRTPEQIAAEEREKTVAEMCDVFMRNKEDVIPVINLCSRLYDAGYRKFEIVDEQP